MKAYSQDLRDRIIRALERGDSHSLIAARFEVSRMYVYNVDSERKKGVRTSRPMGGHRRSEILPQEQIIRQWISDKPDMTLAEIHARLVAEYQITIGPNAVWHQLNKWGLTLKKTQRAAEQNRPDVKASRDEWIARQPSMDGTHLVFLDETFANTSMARRYGRSPRGQRCVAYAPHGHWKTTTFLAALRSDGIIAPLVIDGPMDGAMFLAWVEQFLVPNLRPGDIVIADNLSSHKVAGVRTTIETAGAQYLNLPAYSPDLNPIENFFSKLKARLRGMAARTIEQLWEAIAEILNSTEPDECRNYILGCKYVTI